MEISCHICANQFCLFPVTGPTRYLFLEPLHSCPRKLRGFEKWVKWVWKWLPDPIDTRRHCIDLLCSLPHCPVQHNSKRVERRSRSAHGLRLFAKRPRRMYLRADSRGHPGTCIVQASSRSLYLFADAGRKQTAAGSPSRLRHAAKDQCGLGISVPGRSREQRPLCRHQAVCGCHRQHAGSAVKSRRLAMQAIPWLTATHHTTTTPICAPRGLV